MTDATLPVPDGAAAEDNHSLRLRYSSRASSSNTLRPTTMHGFGSTSEWTLQDSEDGEGIRDGSSTAAPDSRSITTVDGKEEQEPTPLPWRPLAILLLLGAMQPMVYELVFPFINQMLLEIGVVKRHADVGYYSGFIESIYSVTGVLAIIPCAYLTDKMGRKPVILLGMFGLCISTIAFGFSTTYIMLVFWRSIGGAFGEILPAINVMIGELTDESNQAQAFVWSVITYKAGQVFGLPLGGLLTHPERHLEIFNREPWLSYPFALPCVVGGAIAGLGVIFGLLILRETSPFKKHEDQIVADDADEETPLLLASDEPPTKPVKIVEPEEAAWNDVLTHPIIALGLSTGFTTLTNEMVYALYTIFSFTPTSLGGLGLTELEIGTHLAIRAFLPIPFLSLFPRVEKYVGATRLYQLLMGCFTLSVLFLPLLGWLASGVTEGSVPKWWFNTVLMIYFVLWSASSFMWACNRIMYNDAAPSQAHLSKLNAIQQFASLVPQAIAPGLSTSLFAFTLNGNIMGGQLTWVVLFLLSFLAMLQAFTLKELRTGWRAHQH